ncbi:hypothetical protein [Peptostreptococcus canis]|uniref:DUF4179 domain-containing protein n=1 Tax=Peptostreptococcus canis TaxID=1159213 RepID=A0ABR6TL39_9FIRM|nr:hypothetical protein [Peptostreptococcus canis]MBC2576126.1 hypothetical protein [Peptostreptococcus canis]MBP1998341.1 hypothetical protein [Peptostreptococcus canis]
MKKKQFLNSVKRKLLSMKVPKDLINMIIEEISVRFDIIKERGKKDSEVIQELGGIDYIAKQYAQKFGILNKGQIYGSKSKTIYDSSKSKYEGITRAGSKHNTENYEKYSKYNKEKYSDKKQSIENIKGIYNESKEKWDTLPEKIEEKRDRYITNTEGKKKGIFSNIKVLLPIIILVITTTSKIIDSANLNENKSLGAILESLFSGDLGEDSDVNTYIKYVDEFKKMKISAKNVEFSITYGESFSYTMTTRVSEDESLKQMSVKKNGDAIEFDINSSEESDILDVEICIPKDDIEVDYNSEGGYLGIYTNLKKLNAVTNNAEIMIDVANTFDMDIKNKNGKTEMTFQHNDGIFNLQTNGLINDNGNNIAKTGDVIKYTKEKGKKLHKINVKSDIGDIYFNYN